MKNINAIDLRQSKHKLVTDLEQMHTNAVNEKRDLNPDEKLKWDKMTRELEILSTQLRDAEAHESASKSAVRMEAGKLKRNTILGEAARQLATGKSENPEIRALLSSGGTAVINDPVIEDKVVYQMLNRNPLVQAGAQFTLLNANNTQWPKVTAGSTAEWVSEGSAVNDSAPTLGSVTFNLYDACALVKVQKQVIYDSSVDVPALVTTEMENQINNMILQAAFTGSGSGQPEGLDNITNVLTVDAGSTVLANYDKFVDAVAALMAENNDPAKLALIANKDVYAQLEKLKTGIASDLTTLKPPPTIANMPTFWTQAVLSTYATNTETRAYLGDFSQMIIGIGGSFRIELQERYADANQLGFLVWHRVDLQVLHPEAFCMITDIALS